MSRVASDWWVHELDIFIYIILAILHANNIKHKVKKH